MRNRNLSPKFAIFLILLGSACQPESRVVEQPKAVHESSADENAATLRKSPVLQSNESVSLSLAPGQEVLVTLPMKKGGLTEIRSSPLDGTVVVFELYDSQRKQRYEKGEVSISFFEPGDGDFLLVVSQFKVQPLKDSENSEVEIHRRAFGQADTKDIRKVSGYEIEIVEIRASAGYERDHSLVRIKKDGELLKTITGGSLAFLDVPNSFPAADYEKQSAHMIATTWDKTGDGFPDIILGDQVCGSHACSTTTYFIELGNSIKVAEFSNEDGLFATVKNPKGGLLFRGDSKAVLGFKNGVLRPM